MSHQADGNHSCGLNHRIARSMNDGAQGKRRVPGHAPSHGARGMNAVRAHKISDRQVTARHGNIKSAGTDVMSGGGVAANDVHGGSFGNPPFKYTAGVQAGLYNASKGRV